MRLCYHSGLVSTTFFPEAMPPSADPVSRLRKHTRSVRFEAYARADGEALRLYYPRWQREAKTGTD
jgi:hypothetical protein